LIALIVVFAEAAATHQRNLHRREVVSAHDLNVGHVLNRRGGRPSAGSGSCYSRNERSTNAGEACRMRAWQSIAGKQLLVELYKFVLVTDSSGLSVKSSKFS
jgi:hypothetical protein